MRILVTRPEPDATKLAQHLSGLGHEAMVEPLMITELGDVSDIELNGVQALIATSRNALRALARKPDLDCALTLPLYAVGPGTAAAARALGFTTVIQGPRAGRELVALIALQADVNGGPLMHLAGNMKAFDLAGELRHLGFHVLEPLVYAIHPAQRLGQRTVAALSSGRIDAVLLFSAETARTWVRLVNVANLQNEAQRVRHLCLSANVARALGDLAPVDVASAIQPTLEQMLALIAWTAPQSP
jgi:uroporphyrinogen-III synthase